MRVTFKTLKQQTFNLELKEDTLVSEVKKKIEDSQGSEFSTSSQRLIHAGKVMEDGLSLKHYNVSDSGFVVVMSVAKPPIDTSKDTQASTTTTTTTKPSAENSSSTVAKPETASPAKVNTSEDQAKETSTAQDSGESALVVGADYERTVQELVTLGFERTLVTRALRASFNNPDRAFEYLSSGNIPDVGVTEQPASDPPSGTERSSSDPRITEDSIAALESLPQFQQMRALVQANPELLPQLIQQIGADNSDLLRFIRENEQEFLEFLNRPINSDVTDPESNESSDNRSGTDRPGQRHIVLTLSAEDRVAVDRLKALGYSEELVVQAYYACEKNEELAANFLLNEGPDDEMV